MVEAVEQATEIGPELQRRLLRCVKQCVGKPWVKQTGCNDHQGQERQESKFRRDRPQKEDQQEQRHRPENGGLLGKTPSAWNQMEWLDSQEKNHMDEVGPADQDLGWQSWNML